MSTRIIGSLEVQGNLQINGKYAMRVFNGILPDANTGNVSFPFYRKSEIDTVLGMLPVSRIGTMDYLPINISGSFVGASSYSYVDYIQPIIIEDDGTAVMLRSGMNGSSTGFYYSYIRNIRNLATLSQSDLVITNSEYRPSFFESSQKIASFYSTNAYELLFYKTSGASIGETYVLSMTNSTLNAVSHESSQFLTTELSTNFDPIAASVIGENIYIWGQDNSVRAINNGIAIMLYTVPVSSVRSGNTNGLTQVTGFSGTTVRNKSYSASSNIQIYDRYSSTKAEDNPLYLIDDNIRNFENWNYRYNKFNFRAVGNENNSVIRCAMWFSTRAVTIPATSQHYGSGFSFTFNVNTKVITYDMPIGDPIEITATFDTPSSVTFNCVNPYQIDTININGYPLSLGNTGGLFQSFDGFVVANKSRWSSGPTFGIQTLSITPSSTFDSWNLTQRTGSNVKRVDIQPVFGSAIGENLMGIRFVTKNKFILACAGTQDGINYGYESYSTSVLSNTRDFVYESIDSGTLTGYSPQARTVIGNNDNQYTGMISLIEENGDVSAYASSFIENYNKPVQGKYNPSTGVFDGTYSMSNEVMQNIKDKVMTESGITGLTDSMITIYYVPDSSFGNSYAVILGSNSSNNTGVFIIGEVSLSLSGNAITDASVVKTTTNTSYSSISRTVSQTTIRRFTGLTIGKFNGFLYVGVSPSHGFSVPSNTQWPVAICKSKGGSIVSTKWFLQSYSQFSGQEPGIIPGVGFGIYKHSYSDQATKSVFSLYGTTEEQMDGLIGPTGVELERIVIASQEVPQGYNVYFTQEIPVFLGGIFDKIPQVSYDLTSFKANPANSTFYVYVQMNRATRKASYLISESLIAESLTSTYIGTIKTGGSSISEIVSEKVTRFQTYRPSVTKRGSAIPCSAGVPSGSGTRWN